MNSGAARSLIPAGLLLGMLLWCPAAPAPPGRNVILGWYPGHHQVYIAGSVQSGGWQRDAKSWNKVKPGTGFTTYGWSGPRDRLNVSRVVAAEVGGGWYGEVTGGREPTPEDSRGAVLACSAPGPLKMRPVRVQDTNNAVYLRIVRSLLAARGLHVARPRITQLIRLDLNGDGEQEVLLCAHSTTTFTTGIHPRKGDYALALLRCVVAGKVCNLPLSVQVQPRTPRADDGTLRDVYRFLPCPDVNGDGSMEVALQLSYYEGDAVYFYTFNGRALRKVLEAGWGV